MFYNNYVFLCTTIGKSPSAVALENGFSKPTVTKWKNGGKPTDATIQIFADYFRVTLEELKYGDLASADNKKTASPAGDGSENSEEQELLKLFRRLNPEQQARELAFLRDAVGDQDN